MPSLNFFIISYHTRVCDCRPPPKQGSAKTNPCIIIDASGIIIMANKLLHQVWTECGFAESGCLTLHP